MAVTFNQNISPLLSKWKAFMTWRLDLSKYEDVKINANIIYGQISSGNMPPPDYPKFKPEEIQMFKDWMDAGCPEGDSV